MVNARTVAAIRFGVGFRAGATVVSDPASMVQSVRRVDPAEAAFPVVGLKERSVLIQERRDARQAMRKDAEGAKAMREENGRRLRLQGAADIRQLIQRPMATENGFRERLVAFWSNHFTVAARSPLLSVLVPDLIEIAIRPRLAGRFADMLVAVTTHPAMLIYLDQPQSVGPNSRAGKTRDRGLNENLAREILELHTLGVGGAYGQEDVRAFAELLTGLSVNRDGFLFRRGIAEPGAETVLGKSYGGRKARLEDVTEALRDIALHPDTAAHLARKLIRHFIGGKPTEDWVGAMAAAYLESGGALTALYDALLLDERAWTTPFNKVKPPFDYIVSAARAADVSPDALDRMKPGKLRKALTDPLAAMGQPLFRPPGPDGWPEAPDAWITPATLAARLRWAAGFADENLRDRDPCGFLQDALGEAASEFLSLAVAGSESRVEGAALVLASPEFMRR